MQTLFFVHVPKTAGTSFRKAAELYFARDKVHYDYGNNQPETSEKIREYVYQNQDFYRLKLFLKESDAKFFSGHVPVTRYAPLFVQQNVITFVRHPVDRVISEFYHFKRHYSYKGELASFVQQPAFINRQLNMLQGIEPEMLGFIGISERYEESLALFNKLYNVNFPNLSLNLSSDKLSPRYQVEEDVLSIIIKNNQKEIDFYNKCCQLFDQRQRLIELKLPFVHGRIANYHNGNIMGWAFNSENDQPVALSILVNDKMVATATAHELRPAFRQFSVPRESYIGFSAKVGELHQNDTVKVLVTATGQELANSPFTVTV